MSRGREPRLAWLPVLDPRAPRLSGPASPLPEVAHRYLGLGADWSRSSDARNLHCWRARSRARDNHAKSSRRRRRPPAQRGRRYRRAVVCRVGRGRPLDSADLEHVALSEAPSRQTCRFAGPSSSAGLLLSRTASAPSSRARRRSGRDQLRLGRHRLQMGVSVAKEILGDAEVAAFGSLQKACRCPNGQRSRIEL